MHRSLAVLLSAALSFALTLVSPRALGIEILTEENPPLNFTRDGRLTGTGTLVVQEMIKRAGAQAAISVLPWTEAFSRAQNENETCVYSTVRSPARLKLFQWVGPIGRGLYSAFALQEFSDRIAKVDDLKKYRIGVARDARADYLRQRGFPRLMETDNDRSNPDRLTLDPDKPGGIDIWVTQAFMAPSTAKQAGVNVKSVFAGILNQDYWLACNLALPQPVIESFAKALASMRADGSFNKLSDPQAFR